MSPDLSQKFHGTELTIQELKILQYMCEGHSNKAIGVLIGISSLTVKNHIQKILARLGACNRIHAVHRGYEEGILTLPTIQHTLVKGSDRRFHLADVIVGPAKEVHIKNVVTVDATDWLRYDRVLTSESHRILRIDGADVFIRELEFDLLLAFMRQPSLVLTRRILLDQVWGKHEYVEERTVDVHIRRLRNVMEPHSVDIVETVRGFGYRLKPLKPTEPPTI